MVNSDSFIYLPTFILSFNSIFVETAADATEEAKLLSVMASLQAMAFIRRELFNSVKWTSNVIKNQESTTRHKTQGLEAADICHLSIFNGSDLQIFWDDEKLESSLFKRLFGTSRYPAGGLACSVNWNIFILYQIYFKMCLGYINRNQYKYGSYNESQKCAQLYY